MSLTYLSVCSGIEAASVAWKPLGFKPIAFSEIEPFPCEVLQHHYPHIPNLGDMTAIDGAAFRGKADILVGGTPCQAFSYAGLRQGMADDRGNLSLKFVELADAVWPSFIVCENVTGVEMLDSMSSAARTMRSAAFWSESLAALRAFRRRYAASASRGQAHAGAASGVPTVCLVPKEQWRGGLTVPNISRWHNGASVCSLWRVLQAGPIPPKYHLSSKAFAGILRSDSMLSSAPRIGGRYYLQP